LLTVATGASVVLDICAFVARFGIELNVPSEIAVARQKILTILALYLILSIVVVVILSLRLIRPLRALQPETMACIYKHKKSTVNTVPFVVFGGL
jgi:sensor histidine kinase regulating citrate/malate metabolism